MRVVIGRRSGLALVATAALLPALVPRPAGGNAEGPPPGHTGGFGEPTCRACHFDAPEQPAAGALAIEGVPAAYRPGEDYEITVLLRDPGLERAGFQLAVRFEGDEAGTARQAGRLLASDERAVVVEHGEPPVLYALQTAAGAAPSASHEASWTLRWTAPEESAGPVLFHAAANAANDDDSELGDSVHTASARSTPAEPPPEPGGPGACGRSPSVRAPDGSEGACHRVTKARGRTSPRGAGPYGHFQRLLLKEEGRPRHARPDLPRALRHRRLLCWTLVLTTRVACFLCLLRFAELPSSELQLSPRTRAPS